MASFTPLVFETTGGMGKEALVFYRHLADWLSRRGHDSMSYSSTLAWIRCTLSFSLLDLLQCASREQDPSLNVTSMLPRRWATLMAPGTFESPSFFNCPAHLHFLVLGVVGKGCPSSPEKKTKKTKKKQLVKQNKKNTKKEYSY